ncbi:hypothetical protein FJZ21_01365 [Candidatus Pacearchaeota archaeon]|nr:hypothetical protein [Candidatus Pacearchaeota archaeon]
MEVLEKQIIELVAMDRIEIPISSLSGKLKRQKPKLAKDVDLSDWKGNYSGERCYARVESEDLQVARGMKEGIAEFSKRHPKYGAELQSLIEEKRDERETHLYFGMNPGSRLSEADYIGVMKSLGYTEAAAQNLYPVLMETSRAISRKREEERRILIG